MKTDILKKSWPYVAIILAHAIWGVNFLIAKITLLEFPPMTLSFLRFVLAIAFLLPFILAEKKKPRIARKDLPQIFLVGILMITLNIAFFYLGLPKTTVTAASVLTMIIPPLSVLIGWWILKEKVYIVNLVGIILGFIGALLIIGVPFILLGLQSTSENLIGNLFIILASISWVAGALISKKALQKYSTLEITTMIFLVGVITFAIPALTEYLKNPYWYQQVTPLGIFGLFYIAIASSISAYFLFEWGLSKVGIIKADLFQYLEPLLAITLGVIILGEPLRFSFIIGAILVGMGVYWATLAKDKHRHSKVHRH